MALNPNVVVVAPLELITAEHLNNIRANLIRLDNDVVKPFCRFVQPGLAVTPNVDYNFTLTATDVVDPNAMIGSNFVAIPAGWGGLWQFNLEWRFGTNGAAGSLAGWISRSGIRNCQAQVPAHGTISQIIGSSYVVNTPASAVVSFWARNNNAAATSIGFAFSCAFIGRSAV